MPNLNRCIVSHLNCFLTGQLEKDLQENISDDIRLTTPIANLKGHSGVRQFYGILNEYIPRAAFRIISLQIKGPKVFYRWSATSPTASISQGTSILILRGSKIVRQIIDCQVEPQVMNQG